MVARLEIHWQSSDCRLFKDNKQDEITKGMNTYWNDKRTKNQVQRQSNITDCSNNEKPTKELGKSSQNFMGKTRTADQLNSIDIFQNENKTYWSLEWSLWKLHRYFKCLRTIYYPVLHNRMFPILGNVTIFPQIGIILLCLLNFLGIISLFCASYFWKVFSFSLSPLQNGSSYSSFLYCVNLFILNSWE